MTAGPVISPKSTVALISALWSPGPDSLKCISNFPDLFRDTSKKNAIAMLPGIAEN